MTKSAGRSHRLISFTPPARTEVEFVDIRIDRRATELCNQRKLITGSSRKAPSGLSADDSSGIGLLTSRALVHTPGPIDRFASARKVTAYVGLEPLERSSGERQRIGSISKQGSRLLRYLLTEAAQSTSRRDRRGRFNFAPFNRRSGRSSCVSTTSRSTS